MYFSSQFLFSVMMSHWICMCMYVALSLQCSQCFVVVPHFGGFFYSAYAKMNVPDRFGVFGRKYLRWCKLNTRWKPNWTWRSWLFCMEITFLVPICLSRPALHGAHDIFLMDFKIIFVVVSFLATNNNISNSIGKFLRRKFYQFN